jgi:hypothetical protein
MIISAVEPRRRSISTQLGPQCTERCSLVESAKLLVEDSLDVTSMLYSGIFD